LENAEDLSDFSPPRFHGFRIVSGPNIYSGDKPGSYRNLVFTLAAVTEGKFKIRGAVCSVNGNLIKSNDAYVIVMDPGPSDESPYFLHGGEDPFKKIRENLFLKLSIDKQSCFIGEPLVATFKLYSRLQSKSDVVKNPGFYGFGVYDMISVNDRLKSEEKLKGHWFDVHTIRKVQLYPLQAGEFTIDAMELSNKVEFSRSMVNKRTEQEVTENMYNKRSDNKFDAKAEVYEMNLKTEPVVINVRPLPIKNIADTFSGAVGDFSITALIDQDTLSRNQETALTIEIRGAGNFQTISGPTIKWPQGIEAFESSITDMLDNQKVPLAGVKRFKYVFLSDKPGTYLIPPVSFSFFSLKAKTYKTVSTKPLSLFVNSKTKEKRKPDNQPPGENSNSKILFWLTGMIILIAIITVASLKVHYANQKKQRNTPAMDFPALISVDDSLKPAALAVDISGKLFYSELRHCIWTYLNQHLHLSGSLMSKTDLSKTLIGKGINPAMIEELVMLIRECENGIYTNAEIDLRKEELLHNTKRILKDIEAGLS
jgi:hypothetical protein